MLAAKIRTGFNHRFGDRRAFLDDPRFYDSERNHELEKYLPEGFEIVSGPVNLEPWTSALGLDEDVSLEEFERILKEDYNQGISGFNSLNGAGVMVYNHISPDPDGGVAIGFAGQYIGNERVRSLHKRGACVLEHPWNVNPLNFHLDEMGRMIFWDEHFYVKKD